MESNITKTNHQLVVYTHPTKQTFDSNIEMAVRSMRGEVVMDRRQMNYAAKHFKIDFFETLVEVDKLIETIYGIVGFLTEARMDFLIEKITEDYADLYLEDIYVAFKKNLSSIKKYGDLTIPDLMQCLDMYRVQKRTRTNSERDKFHKENITDKGDFILPEAQVWTSYVQMIKNLDARKADEAAELERKKAELAKAVEEAKNYHKHFNDSK